MPKPSIEEQNLIDELRNPETANAAFGKLMQIYAEKLYWQIRRMVFCHDDADDLLQNTFIKAWNNLDKFRGDARLSTWLYKIAVNESINHLNRSKQRNDISTDDAENYLCQQLESDPYFDGDELQLQLQKAIASLPEKQRLVFNMRYFQEMKYEEISEILGTSVGALKASYHHAVKKIEARFAD